MLKCVCVCEQQLMWFYIIHTHTRRQALVSGSIRYLGLGLGHVGRTGKCNARSHINVDKLFNSKSTSKWINILSQHECHHTERNLLLHTAIWMEVYIKTFKRRPKQRRSDIKWENERIQMCCKHTQTHTYTHKHSYKQQQQHISSSLSD